MSTYNVDVLSSFNLEIQLKDIESAIRNILKELLTELVKFKFVMALILEFF